MSVKLIIFLHTTSQSVLGGRMSFSINSIKDVDNIPGITGRIEPTQTKTEMNLLLGYRRNENFRAMTKLGEFYTRFVDVYDEMVIMDEKEIDWKQTLKK
jgi:hypothetical protein